MKKPREYLNYFGIVDMEVLLSKMIKEVQKDAYNKAIEDAIKNAEVEDVWFPNGENSGYYITMVDGYSIFKLKMK